MSSPSHITRAVRSTLMLSAVATAASISAVAQEQVKGTETAAPATTAPEEVVVTGSRLADPNLTSISPVTTVTAQDIQKTGLTRVEDILNQLPMVFAAQNATVSNGADGTSTLDLRGLGPQRTLVLVNGRRLGPGSGDGRNFSDTNQIPALLIDRIDVLTGGASSTYGADAVAGVVNFILNTHFEGVKVDANYSVYQHNNGNAVASIVSDAGFPLPSSSVSPGAQKNLSVVFGSNFADGKGNATFYATYDRSSAILESKYDYSSCSLSLSKSGGFFCGGSQTSAKNGAGGYFQAYSTGTPSVPLYPGPYHAYTVAGNPGTLVPYQSSDLYNFGPLNFFRTPDERWTAGSFINYSINDKLTVYGEAMFTRNNTSAQIAASGDFFNFSFIPCTNPELSPQEQATFCSPANLAAQGNPTETVNGVTIPGTNMFIGRRNVEGGGRVAAFTNDAMRVLVGLKGEIIDGVTFDVSAQHSTVDVASANLNYFDNDLIQNALNVVGLDANGAVLSTYSPTATPACVAAVTKTDTKCVPWNIFTAGGVTPAATNYLSIPLLVDGTVTEQVVTGAVTGDMAKYGLKLPGADDGVSVVLGAEYRDEYATFSPDFESQLGNAAGSGGPTSPVAGNFHVSEGFTEFGVPVLQHKPFAEALSLDAGYRYSVYSLGFNTNTYKLGVQWSPNRDFLVRASYDRAVRAPNIGELFSPQSVVLDGTFDPCSSGPNGLAASGASQAACIATGLTSTQVGNVAPCISSQCNGLVGGNRKLQPEKSDTYSAGIVFHPTFAPSLEFSADYFNIRINDLIGAIGADTIAGLCAQGNLSFCQDFVRDSTGTIFRTPQGYIFDPNVNQGSLFTRGIDFKANYKETLPGYGALRYSYVATKEINLTTTPVNGGPSTECVGKFAGGCTNGNDLAPNPAYRHTFQVDWEAPWRGLDVGLRWRYYGAVTSAFDNTTHIPAYNWFDLLTSVAVTSNVQAQLGVNNLFDRDPPILGGSNCPVVACNGNTFPGSYDALGRYIYAHVTATF